MGIPAGTKIGGITVLAGVAATFIPGLQGIGLSLIMSGAAGLIGSAIAYRPLGGKGGFSTSSTYGFDRAQNAAFEGAPRFFVLGKEKIAPSYINAFTEQNGKKQVLWMQLFCGTGGTYGIEDITEIEINGEPIANYKDAVYRTKFGTATQNAIPGFDKTAWQYNKDQGLKAGERWYYDTQQAVDEVVFFVTFKSGLYKLKDNDIGLCEQHFSIKAKGAGDSDWTRIEPPKEHTEDAQHKFRIFPDINKTDDGHWFIEDATTGVLRLAFRLRLDTDINKAWTSKRKFQIFIKAAEEATAKNVRKAHVTRVEEIVYGAEAYAGSALLGIQVVAQDRLEYDFPNVTCVVKGWKVYDPRTATTAWTQNPALLTRAVLLDANDGCGNWIKSTDLWDGSGESWRTVADYCDADAASSGDHKQDRYHLDLAVDSIQDAKDWLDHILGTFHATLVEYEGKIGIVQDIPAAAVATFDGRQTPTAGRRPILALPDGRPDIQWHEIDTDARANIVAAYFNDEASGYDRSRTEEITDAARLAAGDPEVRKEVYMPGVTREAQAVRLTRRALNMDRLTPRAGSMGLGIGDLDLLPEDKIVVYADTPKEFASGVTLRVLGISYDATNSGRVHFRKYDTGIYSDTSDTLPATPTWVSRATALAKATQAAPSASNVSLQEVNS